MVKHWIFIIDTEQYSGNFERELTAYLTGRIGECGVGAQYSDIFKKETKNKRSTPDFDELLLSVSDDTGCSRPCALQTTPDWFNNGYGGNFRVGNNEPALEAYKKFATERHNEQLAKLRQYQLNPGRLEAGWTPAYINKEIARLEKENAKVAAAKRVSQHPAYLSVGIFFAEKPNSKTIDFLKKRVVGFNAAGNHVADEGGWGRFDPIKVTGFRLAKVEELRHEEVV